MNTKATLTTLTMSAIFTIVSTHAALIYSESFDSPTFVVGQLAGQNGWTGGTNPVVDPVGLSNGGMLGASGNSVRGVTAFGQYNLAAPSVGADTNAGAGEMWFASLVSMTDNSNDDFNYTTFRFDGSQGAFTVGLNDNAFVANGTAAGFTGAQYAEGTTALVVGRLNVVSTGTSQNELLDVWFNPTDSVSVATLNSTSQGRILGRTVEAVSGNWG